MYSGDNIAIEEYSFKCKSFENSCDVINGGSNFKLFVNLIWNQCIIFCNLVWLVCKICIWKVATPIKEMFGVVKIIIYGP